MNIHIERWSAWAPGIETHEQWQQWAADSRPITPAPRPITPAPRPITPNHPDAGRPETSPPQPAPHKQQDITYPKLTVLPAMMRRRLSNLGKIALKVCYDCHDSEHKLRTIFSSRHGEANQTVAILADIIKKEPVSPTKFSLSVHNTSSGLYTITSENTNASTAIAARLDSFEMGFVEAYGLLASGREDKVLLVYADTPLDPPFDILVDYEDPFAAAFVLTAQPSTTSLTLTMQPRDKAHPVSTEPHGLAFMKFLLCQSRLQQTTDRLTWSWSHASTR